MLLNGDNDGEGRRVRGLGGEEIGDAEKLSPFGDKVDLGDPKDVSPTVVVEFMVSGDIQNLGFIQRDDGILVTPMFGRGLSNIEEEPEALGVRQKEAEAGSKQYRIWYDYM